MGTMAAQERKLSYVEIQTKVMPSYHSIQITLLHLQNFTNMNYKFTYPIQNSELLPSEHFEKNNLELFCQH